ncbi:hypothetical protein Cni_G14582 [Canna indica]|uniref:Tetratricopeptide repeat protein n=1 Tax=Canna indica TaxID=4628 RepID=A0AAQ3QDU0_9LILI|nr:hypothetical protein Cni_G14582 [Canna indica]
MNQIRLQRVHACRANYYFKWAVMQEPADAEAMNRYASFLWQEMDDLEAAEEMFLGALEAEPTNNHYESTYAFFLWSTGGFETCFPLGDGNS